jgi:hypothetical protein
MSKSQVHDRLRTADLLGKQELKQIRESGWRDLGIYNHSRKLVRGAGRFFRHRRQ